MGFYSFHLDICFQIKIEVPPAPGLQLYWFSSLASQEPQLLEATCSVVSCLLEGPVHLGPRSVLQHCHLRVSHDSMGRGKQRGCHCLALVWMPRGPAPHLKIPVSSPLGPHSYWRWLLCEWPGYRPLRGTAWPGAS